MVQSGWEGNGSWGRIQAYWIEHTPILSKPLVTRPDPGFGGAVRAEGEGFRLERAKKANQALSSGTKSSSLLSRSDG